MDQRTADRGLRGARIDVTQELLALILLLGSSAIAWSILVLPAWVLLVSVHILVDNLRRPDPGSPERPEQ